MAKRKTPRRLAGRTKQPNRTWVWATAALAVAVVIGLVVWATGRGGDSPQTTAAASIEHIHGLGINPADGTLYAAAHNGVFQLPTGGLAQRVGEGQQDTMGFTIAGPNQFLGSGHPAPGQNGPKHLGLIESSDGGITWKTLSLAGTADFHALRYRHNTVYGYNSVAGQFLISKDKTTWETRSAIGMYDFAVSPTNPDTLLAATQQGTMRSTDGGRTWTPAGGPPTALLDWQRDDLLWAVTTSGDVVTSADGGSAWTPAGKITGQPTAFASYEQDLYVSVHGQGILRSNDRAATWTRLYP